MSRLHYFLVIASLITILPTTTYAVRNPFRRSRRGQNEAAKEAAERKRDIAGFNADVKKLSAMAKKLKSGSLSRTDAADELSEYNRRYSKLTREARELGQVIPTNVPASPTVKDNGALVDKLVINLQKINAQIAGAQTFPELTRTEGLFERYEKILKQKDRDAARTVKKAENNIIPPQVKELEALIRQLKAINNQLKSKELTETTAQPLKNEFLSINARAQTIKKKIKSNDRIPDMQKDRTLTGKAKERFDERHKPLRSIISELNGINKKLSGGGITEREATRLQADFATKQQQAKGLKSQLRSSLKIPTIKEAKTGPQRRLFGLRKESKTEAARFKAATAKDKSEAAKSTAKDTDKKMRDAEEEHERIVREKGANSSEAQAAKLKADRLARDRTETKAAAETAATEAEKAKKNAAKIKKKNSLKNKFFGGGDDDDDDKKKDMPMGGSPMGMGGAPGMQQQYQPPPTPVTANETADPQPEAPPAPEPTAEERAAQKAAAEEHAESVSFLSSMKDKSEDASERASAGDHAVKASGWGDADWGFGGPSSPQPITTTRVLSGLKRNSPPKVVSANAAERVATHESALGILGAGYGG